MLATLITRRIGPSLAAGRMARYVSWLRAAPDSLGRFCAAASASVLLLTSLPMPSVPAQAALLSGKVVSVHDGDTITILDATKKQHRVRLAGIDAPELGQAHGRQSREHLASRLAGREVQVEWFKHDKYRRIVGKVMVEGRDAGLEQIRAGMAWHYRKYESEQTRADRKYYAGSERDAHASKLGLWQDGNPQPPWEYRHRPRSNRPR